VVPAGTGNLLARNLGLPLTEAEAIDVALDGHTRQLDMIEVTADEQPPQRSAVIAGMGVDAMIMDETRPDLKAKIGSAAYFVAAAKALGRLPMDLHVTVDGGRPRHRKAMICAIGNVGELPGSIVLIPGAAPDDGRLDVYLASPHRFTHWVRVLIRLVTRRRHGDDHVDQWRGERVEVRLRKPEPYQLDGDVAGECQTLVAEVDKAALLLRVPAA
jgi:diacylglycerol kinase family enzyme